MTDVAEKTLPAEPSILPVAERTLVLVKPDGVRRGLSGEILRRVEAKGYTLRAVRLMDATPELLAAHYAEHEGKPFYQPLVDFMLSGPVLAVRPYVHNAHYWQVYFDTNRMIREAFGAAGYPVPEEHVRQRNA